MKRSILINASLLLLISVLSGCVLSSSSSSSGTPKSSAPKRLIEKAKGITPPEEGFYLVDKNLNLSPFTGNSVMDVSSFPVASRNPVIILKSSEFNPANMDMRKLRAIVFGEPLSIDSSPCQFLTINRTIIAIDGKKFESCYEVQEYLDTRDPLSSVTIDFLIGTEKYTEVVQLTSYSPIHYFLTHLSTEMEFGEGTAVFYFNEELTPGVYCASHKGHVGGQNCFRVNE